MPPDPASGPRLLTGPRILAMDGSEPEALVVEDGRVAAAGALDDLRRAHPGAERTDLDGALVVPGFHDAHCHPSHLVLARARADLAGAGSVDDVVGTLRARATTTAPGGWVVGHLLPDLPASAGRVDRHALDRVAPDRPVIAIHYSYHRAVVNTVGLGALGYHRPGDAPPGGELPTGPDGELDGWLVERAWLDPALPGPGRPGPLDGLPGTADEALTAVNAELNAVGITSYCEAIVTPAERALFTAADRAGTLTARIGMLLWHTWFDPATWDPEHEHTERLRTVGVKAMVDGALTGGTCRCHEPYTGPAGPTRGLRLLDDAGLDGLVDVATAVGARVAVHANGDEAVEQVVRSIERATARQAPAPSPAHLPAHRIEHCSIVTPDLLARMAAAGIVPVPFGNAVRRHGRRLLDYYGPERVERTCAHRAMLDAGLAVAASTDFPVNPIAPLPVIASMVTRRTEDGVVVGPSQRITPYEALWVYTVGSAHATGEGGRKGRLVPGELADLVVLDRDVTRVDPETIADTRVLSTWLGGEPVSTP